MKQAAAIVALAGAAFFGYRGFHSHQAHSTFEKFADAWATDDVAGAKKFGDAETATRAFEKQNLRGMRSGAIIDAFRGTRYVFESSTRSENGDIALEAMQTIQFDPPGVTSAITGAMYTHIHHSATVRQTPEGWRVVSFEPKFVDMGELRRR